MSAAAPLRLERGVGQGDTRPQPGFPEARRRASAAVLLLDAGHQLLLRAVVGDGRLPLGPLVAAAWGSAGQKHRQGQEARCRLQSGYLYWTITWPCAEF